MLLLADFERMDGGAGKESGLREGVGGGDILVKNVAYLIC